MKIFQRLSALATRDLKQALSTVARRVSVSRSAVVLITLAFLGGFSLEHFRLHLIQWNTTITAQNVSSKLETFVVAIDRRISIGFLTDVAAFETAIIAFLMPLSLDIISKISERYKSEVVLLPFHREWENRILLKLLIVNVVLAITLRFLLPTAEITGWWRAIVWLILGIFIVTTVTVYKLIKKLRRYMTDTAFLIDKLLNDAKASIDD